MCEVFGYKSNEECFADIDLVEKMTHNENQESDFIEFKGVSKSKNRIIEATS